MHHLVPVETIERDGVTMLRRPEEEWRARDGFALTDPGTDLAGALDQANYCIWCHNQQKDTLPHRPPRKGRRLSQDRVRGDPRRLSLDEKISEMNLVRRALQPRRAGDRRGRQPDLRRDRPPHLQRLHEGLHLSAQEPVDIPQIETRTLKDVLALPWGFEIYSLLTRWNPLDLRRPLPKPQSATRCWWSGWGPPASRWRIIC